MAALSRALSFFAPDIEVLEFPAWDMIPPRMAYSPTSRTVEARNWRVHPSRAYLKARRAAPSAASGNPDAPLWLLGIIDNQ
jgi:hypothetical protein